MKRTAIQKIKSMFTVTCGGAVAYQLIYYKKDFNGYYDQYLKPFSQYMSPELAHKVGVTAIKYGLFPTDKIVYPKVLNTKLLDFDLDNPIGIAAGFDKDGDAIAGLRKLGFAIVEIGSVTPEPQPGNPKPRVFRLPEDDAVINRYGFNSEGHEKVYHKVKTIKESNQDTGLLGINLGKNKLSDDATKDYVSGIQKFNDVADYFVINISRDLHIFMYTIHKYHKVKTIKESNQDTGLLGKNKLSDDATNDYVSGIQKFNDVADYFVINISSPNTPGLRSLQKKEELQELLTDINKERNSMNIKRPLFLKLAPDLTKEEMKDVVSVISKKESKVDGLIISNTTIDKSELSNTKFKNETGGLSGRPLTNKSTAMIKTMYKLTKGNVPIIGVGGVFTGQDAYEKILAGASAIQIYTALIYHGPPVIMKIKKELAELLEDNGYNSVSEAIGQGVE